jgi:hypothetical protein
VRQPNRIPATLRLARQSYEQRGWQGLARDTRNFVAFNVLGAKTDFTQQRYRLSEELAQQCDYTIQHGPFAGVRLSRDSWWSAADRGAMLLGMYEQEVLESIGKMRNRFSVLVDIGAADGYYAIGSLRAGWVSHAYCYEVSELGRATIKRNAELNGFSEALTILGEAKAGFMNDLKSEYQVKPQECLVIMDIEGGEEDLLAMSGLNSLAHSVSIVEIHDHLVSESFVGQLESSADRAGLDLHYVATGARNPSQFVELAGWSDDDRWMVCSEGRAHLMRWAIMTPRDVNSMTQSSGADQ